MTALLLCPFCASHLVEAYGDTPSFGDHTWSVKCLDCGAYGPFTDTEAEALAAWNRRAPVPGYRAGAEAMRERAASAALRVWETEATNAEERALLVIAAAAIRALPIPTSEVEP